MKQYIVTNKDRIYETNSLLELKYLLLSNSDETIKVYIAGLGYVSKNYVKSL
jgi:hypothetical protein